LRKLFLIPSIVLIAAPFSGQAQNLPMFGNWERADGVAKVNISRCGENFCARNIWIKPGWQHEKVGDILVMEIEPQNQGLYVGSAFDPQRRARYSFRLTINQDSMQTRGCILGGAICKSIGWQRI